MMGGILASVLAQGAWNRVRARPIDMTEVQHRIGIQAPSTVTAFVKRDGVAFRAHTVLATLITRTNGAPSAVEVQWLKADAHARTSSDLQQVTSGLQWAQERSASDPAIEPTLCTYVEGGYWTGLQREAFNAAGTQCAHPRAAEYAASGIHTGPGIIELVDVPGRRGGLQSSTATSGLVNIVIQREAFAAEGLWHDPDCFELSVPSSGVKGENRRDASRRSLTSPWATDTSSNGRRIAPASW